MGEWASYKEVAGSSPAPKIKRKGESPMDNYITRGEHEEFAKRIEEEDNRQNRRIGLLEDNLKQLNALTLAVEKMAMSLENLAKEQKKQGDILEELENAPVKDWNTFKDGIIKAIAGAIGGGIITAFVLIMYFFT